VTVFRSRLGGEGNAEYAEVAEEMERAARASPGFVDFKRFDADDGERVSLITFATIEDQHAWRDDLGHRHAQQRGRDVFYASYSIQVGECTHVSQWANGES
jgi:heme-degrading monooxygenase HmoA